MSGAPLLSITDLSLGFRGPGGVALPDAVAHLSLELSPGESVALVGESGSGKSSVARAILGLHAPGALARSSGSVRWRGRELLGAPERELVRVRGSEIAMIFQEPMSALNPVLTIGAQVTEAAAIENHLTRRERAALAESLLDRVHLPDPAVRAREYPHQLSGGMRQRVMIAMALALGPSLLIADEPTTALDATTQREILTLLRELVEGHAMAMLLITHDLAVAAELSRRICVMYAGQLVEVGTTQEVLGRPRHPYTAGLLRSIPRGRTEGRRSYAIPPGTGAPLGGAGCRFRDRCERAEPRCAQEEPVLEDGVRCLLPISHDPRGEA